MPEETQTADASAETAAPNAETQQTDSAREELEKENALLRDRILRMQAEFDNYRKRTERERSEFSEYAGEQTITAMLPVLDDFDRALKVARETNAPETFLKGLELIYGRFLETLKRQGLEPLDAEGAQFDPHLHEAIGRVETAEHEDGTVVQEFQRGYNYKKRLLRPAMVQVAVKPREQA